MRVGWGSTSLWMLWLVEMRMSTLLRVSWMWTPPGRTVQWVNLSLTALLSRLVSRDCSTSCTVSPDVDLQRVPVFICLCTAVSGWGFINTQEQDQGKAQKGDVAHLQLLTAHIQVCQITRVSTKGWDNDAALPLWLTQRISCKVHTSLVESF